MKSQIPTESKLMAPAEDELDNKIEVTPWTTILKFFLKTYDLKNESLDTQVGNVYECNILVFWESRIEDVRPSVVWEFNDED